LFFVIRTLAIETSCDDTSLSIVSFDGKVFAVEKLLAYSQIDDHQKYGGVVPEFASRLHSEKIITVLQNIWRDEIQKTDFISVTTHPGLPGSLVVGKAVAAFLSKHFDKPLVEVNHVYGHLFSLLLERNVEDIQFPLVVLTASGGHNDIYLVETLKRWNDETLANNNLERKEFWWYHITRLGKTLDDAAGECFDKVSRMLGGPYPGGRWIDDKAAQWKANDLVAYKRIFLSKDEYDFSFSWMKSQTSFLLKELEKRWIPLSEELICDIAYEFQEAVIEVLVKKLLRAAIQYGAKTVGIAWWVSSSERLRQYLNERGSHEQVKWEKVDILKDVQFLRPAKKVYSTDNGAMIWLAGILKFKESSI
jgi:N6-L-threonylcarbamoyladenine synthase